MCVNTSNLWVVYIVKCSDDTLYTGITNNIRKRIIAHNKGKGAKYTRGRCPVNLVWLKVCEDKSSASKLEYKVKRLSREEKLKLIANEIAL